MVNSDRETTTVLEVATAAAVVTTTTATRVTRERDTNTQ